MRITTPGEGAAGSATVSITGAGVVASGAFTGTLRVEHPMRKMGRRINQRVFRLKVKFFIMFFSIFLSRCTLCRCRMSIVSDAMREVQVKIHGENELLTP